MDITDGWFSFERAGQTKRPDSFQSPELDGLFLERSEIRISAAWCVSSPDLRLIYFWGDRVKFNVSFDIPGRFGYYGRKFRPFFEQFVSGSGALLAPEVCRSAVSSPIKYVGRREIGKDIALELYAGKGLIFFYEVGVVKKKAVSDLDVRTFLLDRSERGYEFGRQASSFFERVPRELLKVDGGLEKLFPQYFGPNCFDLLLEPNVPFAWPWQKSLHMKNGAIHQREISTISLVMDIRNSSSAMLLTPDAPRFAMFVDEAIEGAREAITRNGGYFDKDTGDGVVGHFEGPDDFRQDIGPLTQALMAARQISTNTTRLCVEYQANLSLLLRGLGCAVGLFAGRAVWLYSWRGIRAIGNSVVNASRICANAGAGEIGYCNTISQLIQSRVIQTDVFPVTGVARPIKVSEIRDEAIPEASFVQIS